METRVGSTCARLGTSAHSPPLSTMNVTYMSLCSYGWDWGPVLMTAGPWKPIRLETYATRIADLDVRPRVDAKLSAAVDIAFELSRGGAHTASVSLQDPEGKVVVGQTNISVKSERAEAHFKLSIAYDLTSGRLKGAIEHVQGAIESVNARIAELKVGLEGQAPSSGAKPVSSSGKGKGKGASTVERDDLVEKMTKPQIEAEIKELTGLRDELTNKVCCVLIFHSS